MATAAGDGQHELRAVGVLAHPLRPTSFSVAEHVAASLKTHGIDAWVRTRWEHAEVQAHIARCQMVIAIGGDGAMLRAARACAPHNVPVLGINMGQLGFLTEITAPAEWDQALGKVIQGEWWIEHRMMLTVRIIRSGETVMSAEALNDVVISGSIFGRMVELATDIDGHWTTTYYADALVIASATGSTAYALACGGPILPPELKNILVVAAAPHLSMDRPIVLSEGSVVEVTPSARGEIVVTADGSVIGKLDPGDKVRVCASEHLSQFVRLRARNYFYRSLLDRLEPRVRRADHRRTDE